MSPNDSDLLKNIIQIALICMCIWGGLGLIEGKGFFGGIENRFEAIGDIVVMVLKGLVFIGVGWFIIEKLKDRDNKSTRS
jgi:hypothetical protein